jgi:hypothetical protein
MSRKGKRALIAEPRGYTFDLTLGAEDECNPCETELRLLTFEGIERLLAARVKNLHHQGLRLVDVLMWFGHCFQIGPVDYSVFTVCNLFRHLSCARAKTKEQFS